MKPIQILVLVTAMALAATAQNTSSTNQNSGSGGQTSGTTKHQDTSASSSKSSTGKGPQKAGSGTPGVQVIVPPKTSAKANTSSKNASAAAGPSKATGATSTTSKSIPQSAAAKPSPAANNNAANNKGTGTASKNTGATTSQKAPVLTVNPAQKSGTSGAQKPTVAAKNPPSPAAKDKKDKKSVAAKAVSVPNKTQVKIVPPKKGSGKAPAGNTETPTITATGKRRDPFMSIIRAAPSGPSGPNCSVGKRCLFIPELELKGIAKDPDGQMLAVVVSNNRRAYFLRENDQVFNGSVQKITSDSIVFREFATDHLGRETAHEVVKRIPKS